MKPSNHLLPYLFIPVFLLLFLSEAFAAGALFVRPRWSDQEYEKMWIKSINASVDIQEQIAVTHIDQKFFNEMNTSVEAIFVFPLPENAVITEMVYWVNGERFVAEIRERQQAINDYNNKLRQWLDPALLEYLGDNLFRLSIVPINANSEVRTEITYVELLKYDLGTVDYKFLLNTTGLSSKPLETVFVSVEAESQNAFKSFTSPSHQNSTATSIQKVSENQYNLFFGDENFYPDRDLVIKFETEREEVDFHVLTYTPVSADSFGTDSYYVLWITPPDDLGDNEILPKDIVFTVDVSSSMEGERMTQLKTALHSFLGLLNSEDRFNIITFGTFVEKFKNDLVDADTTNISEALAFVDQLYALGMTNIDDALTESLNQGYRDISMNNLIFLTDGHPTWGETNQDSILAHVQQNIKNDMRLFSFGIGHDVSESLLYTLAADNHGYAKFITSDDSIALVVQDHFTRISKPVLRDLQVDLGGLDTWDRYPKTMNDLFWGSQLTQMGLYSNSGQFNVSLKGYLKQDSIEYQKTINFTDTSGGHRFVPRLWAKSKIDHLLSLIEIYGENDELVDQIIELSLKYQILTPYTALYSDPDATSVNEKNLLPKDFVLKQNYPNPFNPTTKIEYSLPDKKASYRVVLKIYNALGQLVAVLVDEVQSPGNYSVTWNGLDMNGKPVPSGIYFYSINVENFNQVKKMSLIR